MLAERLTWHDTDCWLVNTGWSGGPYGTGKRMSIGVTRKLIAAAGRKNVIGKPILYQTTREFLIQFGLKDLSELPSLKEFEEIRRMAFADAEQPELPGLEEPPVQVADDVGDLPSQED